MSLLDFFMKYVIVKALDANELHLHLELLRERQPMYTHAMFAMAETPLVV